MDNLLFKFCSGSGAVKILEKNCIFITSPLDFNDPFEMRPAWTQEHEENYAKDVALRNKLVVGLPFLIATKDGLVPSGGILPTPPNHQPTSVENQRGTSDGHNAEVFRNFHDHFRVLCLSKGILDEPSNIHSTLMWSHYADQFQGICLGLDPTKFYTGHPPGGFAVQYPPERKSLPPSHYECWQALFRETDHAEDFKRYLDLLTFKSPAWAYENEVRMIYSWADLLKGDHHKPVFFACDACRANKIPIEKCGHQTYRDALKLPAEAFRAVIFGTDCLPSIVEQVLEILSEPCFEGVERYWSSYASSNYAVQYVKEKPGKDYISFIQKYRAEQFADAKGHWTRKEDGIVKHLAGKGTNFVLPIKTPTKPAEATPVTNDSPTPAPKKAASRPSSATNE